MRPGRSQIAKSLKGIQGAPGGWRGILPSWMLKAGNLFFDPRSNAIDLVAELKARCSSVSVLMSSIHDETRYAQRSLEAGASGYIDKQEASLEMVNAIRCVLAGGIYLSQRMAEQLRRCGATAPGGLSSDTTGSPAPDPPICDGSGAKA